MEKREFRITGQVPAQKNSKRVAYNRRTGKPFIMTETRVKEWQYQAWAETCSVQPIQGPVSIQMRFYNKDARKRDIDNMMTSVLDLIKNGKMIEDDDCFVVRRIVGEFMGQSKDDPHVDVTIESVDTHEDL